MKSFREYLEESEAVYDCPTVGDDFAINIREECLLETYVIDESDDSIVLHADSTMISLLEDYGMVAREQQDEDLLEQGPSGVPRDPRMAKSMADLENELDQARGGTPPSLDQDLEKFRSRAQAGEVGTPGRWSQMSDIEKRELQSQGFGPQPTTNEELTTRDVRQRANQAFQDFDSQSDPKDTATQWAEKISKTVPKTRIDTTNFTDYQRYELAKKIGTAPPGGFDEWQKNRAARTQPQPATPSTTVPTNEAEYRGRNVPLGKKMAGDVKKSKVYVRKPNGNVVKVEFGDPNMRIKKSNPARRRSFRARHHCENPGPRWKARYWSCRAW